MPFYDLFATSDGRHMSVGPLEPQFYEVFVQLLGIQDAPDRFDFEQTPELRRRITEAFATRTQAEWSEAFEGTDACVAPILPLSEAMGHPHMAAREVFVEHEGVRQPAPAPRFSRTTASLSLPPRPEAGADTREALAAWGVEDVDGLLARGVAVQA
jgi:alpha-methylacyl-CoA racemase